MAYTLNEEIPCRTEACTGREHSPASACKSVYDIILDAIKDVKGDVANVDALAKEETLLAKVVELKAALNSIDFTTIEQAIKDVKGVAAKEGTLVESTNAITSKINAVLSRVSASEMTLIQGVGDILNALDNIDVDVDLTEVAKEATLNSAKEEIIEAVNSAQVDIDTSNLASKNLEDFFGVVPDDSEEIMTNEEITQELEDIFNIIFN